MHISNCTYNNDADIGQDHGIQKMIFFIYVFVVWHSAGEDTNVSTNQLGDWE